MKKETDKNKKVNLGTTIGVIAVILICSISYFTIQYFLDKDLEKEEEKLEEIIERVGTVEEETVEVLVAKFNTEIMDNTNWELLPINDANLVIENEMYWYPIYQDIILGVEAVEFTGDKTKDIVKMMYLQVGKDSEFQKEWQEYGKYLIKGNNNDITDAQIMELFEEAKELQTKEELANNGTGIYFGIYETEKDIMYQLRRIY